MINAIPVIGWALSLFFMASLAVPFWFIWTVCGIGATYARVLVARRLSRAGFWQCVGVSLPSASDSNDAPVGQLPRGYKMG